MGHERRPRSLRGRPVAVAPGARGQAMVELAIFGSFMLLVLVMLVRYGLSGYYAQAITQDAFRAALKRAYETRAYGPYPGSEVTIKPRPDCPMCLSAPDPSLPDCPVTPDCRFSPDNQGQVVLVRDVYIPDPSNLFASGVHTPVSASASVVWGTDRAEFTPNDVENSTDLPKALYRINDREIMTQSERFWTEDLVYSAAIPAALCDYFNIFGTVYVDFYDAAGNFLKAGVSYKGCANDGGEAKITFEDDDAVPATLTLQIADACLGDFLDVESCETACAKATAAGLPLPTYCGELPAEGTLQGLDTGNVVRRTTRNNRHVHSEDRTAIRSSTTISEQATVERDMYFSPVWYEDDDPDDGKPPRLDVDTTVGRSRQQDWSTTWP